MIVTIDKTMLGKHCMLFCSHCGTDTNHALGTSGMIYVCGCGEVIDIEFVESEEEDE